MGLEDIVNFLMKPVEALASMVYDVCFTTKVAVSTGKDGKKSYTRTYSGSTLQKACATMGSDYKKAKDTVMKYTLRPVDSVLSGVYNTVESILTTAYTALDKKVISPVSEYFYTHPWTWRAGAVLGMTTLALTGAYLAYVPMYMILA